MKLKAIFVLGLVVISALAISGCLSNGPTAKMDEINNIGTTSFKSEDEMQIFFNNIPQNSRGNAVGGTTNSSTMVMDSAPASNTTVPAPTSAPPASDSASPPSSPPSESSSLRESNSSDRYSQTNVQVAGVDEADIIKTDGKFIYYSPGLNYPVNVTLNEESKYSYYNYDTVQKTFVIEALPPEAAYILSNIPDVGGSLYLTKDTLIITNSQTLTAYDITNPSAPQKMWEQNFDGNYVDSRMIGDQLYFVTREYRVQYPVVYLGNTISYQDCYYPYGPGIIQPGTNVTYFVSSVDIKTGSFDKTIALIGSYNTILYASENHLYLTNYYYPNTQQIELHFIQEHGDDYFPADVMNDVRKFMSYELSDSVKSIAVQERIQEYFSTLIFNDGSNNARTRFYNDYNKYAEPIINEGERTTITKIDLETFSVKSGFVYGRIHDQFSLDEYNGYMRAIATAGNNWRNPLRPQETSVYVFNDDMDVVGRLSGIAPREDVKSSRYVGDRLYLVTFEQIDPFFVIDLSNPEKPKILGELKIPGYSTYLHPINETLVIGVGYADNGRSSKIALFDVKNVNKPIELDTYTFSNRSFFLDDYHAFLWDAEKSLMVIPGYEHAYVFEVKNNKLSLIKDDYHKESLVKRSIYINDYLYIFSTSEVHVYDQDTWQRLNVISIPQPEYPNSYSPYPYPVYW